MKSNQQEQRKQARDGKAETRLGKLDFESDYVTEETAAKLREELQFQAAVQTYLWSFPIANVMSLRDGHRAVGIKNTAIPIFEDYLTPKTVVPTGNQSTIYAYNVLTLGEGADGSGRAPGRSGFRSGCIATTSRGFGPTWPRQG
jgi:hypothetical protein